MGGNALPEVPTRRLPASEFHPLAKTLAAEFRKAFGVRAEAIKSYANKEDFGDLDLLIENAGRLTTHSGQDELEAFAREIGHARVFKPNGPVVSFDYRSSPLEKLGFQVDLIRTAPEDFEAALNYFSYNDLGNLVGRIAHKMGFTYGHQGLLYPVRLSQTHLLTVIPVTKQTDRALTFLGFNPARFFSGFDSLDAIFEYVATSSYFNPEVYLLENRNHASRTRDKKRKTYAGFLGHIRELPSDHPVYVFPEDKQVWLDRAFSSFPEFEPRYQEAIREREKKEAFRLVFSGAVVAQWTGLEGDALGKLMRHIQSRAQQDFGSVRGLYDSKGFEALQKFCLSAWQEMKQEQEKEATFRKTF